jgi:hypothetical protein
MWLVGDRSCTLKLGFRRGCVANSCDINKVFGPLNILRSDIWERSLADGLFHCLLYLFLAKSTEHGRKRERSVINIKDNGKEKEGENYTQTRMWKKYGKS